MGYRSDIKIAFYLTEGAHEKPQPPLPSAALKLWVDENYPVGEAEEWGATIEHGDDYVLLTYRDVKWYPNYEHPNKVMDALGLFSNTFRSDERDHRAQYEMLRIGEEDNDIEAERSSYSDYRLCVERSIIFE